MISYFAHWKADNLESTVNDHITSQCILTNWVGSNLDPESAKLNQFHCIFGISNTALILVDWKYSRKVEKLLW